MKTPGKMVVSVVGMTSLLTVLPGCSTWFAGSNDPSTRGENQKYFYSPHSVHEERDPWVRDRIEPDDRRGQDADRE
jgi:hypothetical protein